METTIVLYGIYLLGWPLETLEKYQYRWVPTKAINPKPFVQNSQEDSSKGSWDFPGCSSVTTRATTARDYTKSSDGSSSGPNHSWLPGPQR